jgi:pimeloyl-ACP methyl ester carboxylesterase
MAKLEPVTGKYIYIKVQGVEYRVYFEENGKGIPLLCQHTAAADGRQWRHVLNDDEVTNRYRVIVPDLPYHGKSLPPESVPWWQQEYKLTMDFFVDFYIQLSRALELERPVFIGASMGGNLAPDLALKCPDDFRAVIGIGASMRVQGPKNFHAWYRHPRISNNFKAAAMLGMTSPHTSEKYKREIFWEYSQSAPPVHTGDLYYFSIDHDLTDKAQLIDTSRVSVYLLAGEYDPGASPNATRELAEKIRGARFVAMKGIGHFAMSEDYEAFKRYLMPILREIARSG